MFLLVVDERELYKKCRFSRDVEMWILVDEREGKMNLREREL
jgi:hypothetical protein